VTKRFAKLDENNIVIDIQAVEDAEAVTEQNGIDFLRHIHKDNSNWAESVDRTAEIGDTYDPETKLFTAAQPYPSWTLNENRQWVPPVEYPEDGESHTWNEETQSWD
tara:strand:- start:726 stop:1046 length:321 start_codon:yes stop_codon:yes gene_type:complete